MNLPSSAFIGFSFLVSEVLLGLSRRARAGSTKEDAHSLRVLWIVIGFSVFFAQFALHAWRGARLPDASTWAATGVVLFILGLILRWYAIIRLGRFFTVNVAIAADHEVVESGPYRFIRHPAYSGALLAFLGFGLTMINWASLLILLVPIALAFAYRIKVEEDALIAALGERYRAYCERTKRLVPFIY